MNWRSRLLLRCLSPGVLLAGIPALAGAEEIPWSADRPLRWDDFAGPVARQAPPENVAMTASSLKWGYEYSVEQAGDACTYHITNIRTAATFSTDDSWVKPGHATAAVLEHEQGHFDISQIYRLMLEESVHGLIGASGECEGKSARRVSNFVENEIARRVEPLYREIWQAHLNTQASYDEESGHGTRAAAQRSWLVRIAAGLGGRRWGEFAQSSARR